MTGNELAAWREARGLSHIELAALLKTTRMTIWRWEHAKREIPPYLPLALERLAQLLPTPAPTSPDRP
jgi:transcriptional regulator with XRE-family HTH domain